MAFSLLLLATVSSPSKVVVVLLPEEIVEHLPFLVENALDELLIFDLDLNTSFLRIY